MKKITLNYWTDLVECGIKNPLGGSVTVELNEDEETLFAAAIEPAKESGDMLCYFEEKLPETLSKKICTAITEDFKRVDAEEVLGRIGKEAFDRYMTDEEFDSTPLQDLVEMLIDETNYDDPYDQYCIIDIEIKNSINLINDNDYVSSSLWS